MPPKNTSTTMAQRNLLRRKSREDPRLTHAQLGVWLEETEGIKVSRPAITKTLKRPKELFGNVNHVDEGSKRQKSVRFPLMEKALIEWFELYQDRIQMNGYLLQTKGKFFLQALYGEDAQLQFSESWLSSFKERHNIQAYRTVGGSESVNMQTLQEVLLGLRAKLDRYLWKDIYTMDETSLFFRMQPDRSLATKQLEGRKKDKERVTIVNCANGDGSDKLPLWVIGKFERPRCFKNVQLGNLGMTYRYNTKAWMTLKIFHDWLKWFDSRVNRRVLLILDNCSEHATSTTLPPLTNTEVVYLPPNMASKLQPMDAGIIRSFKAHYRLRFSELILRHLENDIDNPSRIDPLAGINIAVLSWEEVTSETITNCFRHCKIRTPAELEDTMLEDDDNVMIQLTNTLYRMPYKDPMSIDFLLNHPDEQEVKFTPTEEDIVEELQQATTEPVEETEGEIAVLPELSIAQAVRAMEQLALFWRFQDYDTQEMSAMSNKMLRVLHSAQKKRLLQLTMYDYFERL